MPRRMPVLGHDDARKGPGEAIDGRHHGIAIGHAEAAAGAEIVLHVDDYEDVAAAR